MHRIIQDVRYAVRGLIKTPAFTLGVMLTLALGIGINATMFGVVDALFLRAPGGVKHSDGLVRVYYQRSFGGAPPSFAGSSSTFPTYADLRDGVPAFDLTTAYTTRSLGLGRGAEAIQVKAAVVSHQFFPMLELQPSLGNFFTEREDRTGGDRVAVLTWRFWQRQYGGDRSIVGRSLVLGKGTYTVIGVGPRDFTGIDLAPVDLILPIHPAAEGDVVSPEAIGSRNWWWMSTVARLKTGVPVATAAAQATMAFRRGVSEKRKDSTSRVLLGAIQESRSPQASNDAKVALWIGVVACIVLLIACANVANLLLARGVARRRELAVRASLGAGRAALIRAMLTESMVLALAGGATAIVLALWAGGAARGFLLPDLPADVPLIDPRMLLFTAGAIIAATLLTGLVPAIQASRTDLVSAFKSGGHGASGHGTRTRSALLVAQIAPTLVLLVGAGLFVRSLSNVQHIDTGFDAERVLSVRMNFSGAGIPNEEANAVYLRLLDRFQRLPGVEGAAASMGTPFNSAYAESFRAEGVDSLPSVKSGGPYIQAITPGYLATMGTRVIRGRDFGETDRAGGPPVTIVSASFARLVWPAKEAIGKCLYQGDDSVKTCTRVVGVAADAKRGGITETESLIYYVPFAQREKPVVNGVFVRMRPGTRGLQAALMREVQAEGNLPFATIQSIADQVAPQLRSWRLGASAFTAFGLLALLIAATGIFAVLSYGVSQRTKEIGVRVALGAQASHVVRLVVGQGLRAALIGTALGAIGAFALGRAIASLLYQVPATDPLVFVGVVVVLLAVALLAAYLPARRASSIAPMIALRSE